MEHTILSRSLFKKILQWKNIVSEFIQQVDSHHIFLLSAGISFNAILYLIPLILIGIFLTKLIFEINNFNNTIANLILSFLPDTENTYSIISSILTETNKIFSLSTIVGWVGILSLLWLSSTLISSLRRGLNVIFDTVTKRVFVFYKIKDILLTIILNFFILLLGYLFPMFNFLKEFIATNLPQTFGKILFVLSAQFFWIWIYFIFFFFVYRFLPNKKVDIKVVLLSSIICTILAEASRYLFTFYILNIANYSRFYGAYGFFASIVIWVYYLFFIILFSAELSMFILNKKWTKERN